MAVDNERTLCRQLEELAEKMCDGYCKWPEQSKDEDELFEQHCNGCPMGWLV